MEYILIDNDDEIYSFITHCETLSEIAVDFEAEFNLHIYGEHLCLIQVYDREKYYIIDPRSRRVTQKALCAFFESDVTKVWFSFQSDNALVYKKYNCTIKNVIDIQSYSKALSYTGGLASLITMLLDVDLNFGSKKRLQQTNWLKRPLSDEQIRYALSDVSYLFDLRDKLTIAAANEGVLDKANYYLKESVRVPKQKPGWESLISSRALTAEGRVCLREYYLARDIVARRFNVPAFYVLDKHKIIELSKKCPKKIEEVYRIISPIPPRFDSFLKESMRKAHSKIYLR